MHSVIAERIKLKYSPVVVLFTDQKPEGALEYVPGRWGCVTAMLTAAAKGRTAVFSKETCTCGGGRIGLGLDTDFGEGFEYFLSTGNPDLPAVAGIAEPEGFKKTPALAKAWIDETPIRQIKEKYVVFKPLTEVAGNESPQIVIFYANPDQLTALVVLANYGRPSSDNVIVPFASGCMTACLYAYAEMDKEQPKAVIGLTDVSARPFIDADLLSFSVPYNMFQEMESNVPGSFLEKEEWKRVCKRI